MTTNAREYLKSLVEALLVFCITTIVVSLIHYSEIRGSSVFIPAVWGLGALLPRVRDKSAISLLGLTRSHLALGLKYYLLSTLVLFPLFGGGFLVYCRLGMPLPRPIVPSGVSLTEWILYQFIFVGVFEELFFRGYLQTQVEGISCAMTSWKIGIFGLPIVASAFLFSVAHVAVELNPARFVVFLPGLLFAWLRAKTGSLVAPILSHGSANIFFMVMLESVS